MWQSLIAVVGTLAGVLLTSLAQQRTARTERSAAERTARRRDALDAVAQLAAALADHRRAMWVREEQRLAGGDWTTAREASHETRAAITAPAVRVAVLVPELAPAVKAAETATYALRGAADHQTLAAARQDAVAAAETLVHDAGRILA
jgi:hypothetical protein